MGAAPLLPDEEPGSRDVNARVTRWLQTAPEAVFAVFAIVASFSTYFCMYAFRRPFTAAGYAGYASFFGSEVKLKILYVVSQVIGYTLSKFLGIKVVSEATAAGRARAIALLIAASWFALLLFAVIPAPWNAMAMFLNGIPLGMVWGLVFGFLEGRRLTEVLGAGLSASFIVASGVVKAVGVSLISAGVPELWMPFVVGAFFLPPMLLFVWMLRVLPPPSALDEQLRVKRAPMNAAARRQFLGRYLFGIVVLTLIYAVITAYRDFRDSFAVEIWSALGYAEQPSVLATTELWIGFFILIVLAALYRIRSNRFAFLVVHGVMAFGGAMIGIATWCHSAGYISPVTWMTLIGFGLYLVYVPYNSMLFDRLIAASGQIATAGFLIYVADAFGYLGSVGVMLFKNFGKPDLSWLEFFNDFSYVTAAIGTVTFGISIVYFAARLKRGDASVPTQP